MPPIRSLSGLDPTRTYTYADYLTWQFEGWEEILDGQLVVRHPAAFDTSHQWVTTNLIRALQSKARPRGIGCCRMTSVALGRPDSATVIVPDFFLYHDPTHLTRQGFEGTPSCIIEITSPTTVSYDRKTKYQLYQRYGVPEYWLIIPATKTVYTYLLSENRYESREESFKPGPIPFLAFPGLTLDWSDVFAP